MEVVYQLSFIEHIFVCVDCLVYFTFFLCFQALVHPYFFTSPLPCQLSGMPKPMDGHRQQFKAKEYDTEKPVEELFSDLKKLLTS
jgi:hypothetical protein